MLFHPVLSCYTSSPHTATCIKTILLSLTSLVTLFQQTTANPCIFIKHAIWFIHYLNLHMAMYCKIHSEPLLHWLDISLICIYIISTLTTLLWWEWLFKYLTKLLGITTVPSHKCLIKTCSSSCLNTFHSNKLAQPKALLDDYLIIKSQMFSSVSKANHHTYHFTSISNLTTSSPGLSKA